jgi:ligand-binding sensor domain-containing protein/signal transduction histidine kinase
MRKVIIIWFFVVWAQASFGQQYSLRNYKAIDGLPQSQVNTILEDDNGYLWIGTRGGGVARFDGREFKVYTTLDGLLSNVVDFLKLDKHKNLWIFHPHGITKFDGLVFKRFQQPGLPSNNRKINQAFEHKDTLFFLSSDGLGKIYRDSVHHWSHTFSNDVGIRYLYVTPQKDVLLYLTDGSFYVKNASGEFRLNHKKYFNKVFGAPFNYKGDVYIPSDSGCFKFDLVRKEFLPSNLPARNAIVCYDSLNDVFWTRNRNYLLKEKLYARNSEIDTVLRDIHVWQILVDSEGNTWFATNGSGLYKYFIQDFNRFSSESFNTVMAICRDSRGFNWIGSMTTGLWKIKDNKVTSYYDDKFSYRNSIGAIKESPTGDVWIGSHDGLGRYNADFDKITWYSRKDGLSNAAISSMQFDEKQNLWIGTYGGGVNRFDGKNFRAFTTRKGLSSNVVNSIHYSLYHKKLFIGTEFGLSSLANERAEHLSIGGIENTGILSINSFRDSLLLIGTGGAGVAIYNPKTRVKKLLTTHHGLASDFIYFVVADEIDYVWIGTEKGITKVKLNQNLEIVENLHYDYDNGLTGVETNHNAFCFTKDKKLFGLVDGLYEYNAVKRNKNKSFDLHLTNIEILFGQFSARSYSDSLKGFFRIPVNPRLPPDKNHITFHFNKVDKRNPKSIKFKYFLENFDKAWSQPSFNNQATYSNLPPGEYIFKVMSTNNEGSWSPEKQIVYAFSVRTPFYLTASFIVGLFILLAGSITLVLYLRVKQRMNKVITLERIRAKEQETLRKEIARDFHDEMGNQLTRIINYISLLKLNSVHNNGQGESDDLYTKVENSAKYLYTGTRDFIWSIDPGNDELSKLFIHIRDFGEQLFEEKNINFRAFNEIKDKTKLPYGFSREANLIFKEVMTNAFKYSQAENVTLSLKHDEQGYEFTFEDDGVGFYTGEIQKLNGLKNIRERADRISAILRIQSTKNQGTKVVLSFKLNKTLKYGLTL